jgi:Leucine Rich repeat
MDCLRENPTRFTSLEIVNGNGFDNPAVLNIIRNGLLDCPFITSVSFSCTNLTSEGLDLLRPAFYNTSITSLDISHNNIQGQQKVVMYHTLVFNGYPREGAFPEGFNFVSLIVLLLDHVYYPILCGRGKTVCNHDT